jgi:hypothetical protein
MGWLAVELARPQRFELGARWKLDRQPPTVKKYCI